MTGHSEAGSDERYRGFHLPHVLSGLGYFISGNEYREVYQKDGGRIFLDLACLSPCINLSYFSCWLYHYRLAIHKHADKCTPSHMIMTNKQWVKTEEGFLAVWSCGHFITLTH